MSVCVGLCMCARVCVCVCVCNLGRAGESLRLFRRGTCQRNWPPDSHARLISMALNQPECISRRTKLEQITAIRKLHQGPARPRAETASYF